MAKKPAYLWYPGDWLKDQAVRKCSLAAKGAWRELLDLMHADDTDRLTGDAAQFARLLSTSPEEAEALVLELLENGVCDLDGQASRERHAVTLRDKKVTLVSRRFARERKARDDHNLRQQRYRNAHGR